MDQFATIPLGATQPQCFDVPPGMGLLSKSAKAPTYPPGVCQALGGEPSGEAVPTGPSTFCCLP